MAIGWLNNVAEAIALLYQSRLETVAWDEVNDHVKTKALMNAYNRLRFDPTFSFPTSPDVAELEKLKIAQAEMAYYLLIHQSDEDRRKGIQVQGVTKAGVVAEEYDPISATVLPVPAFVLAILSQWIVSAPLIYSVDLKRAEDAKSDEGKLIPPVAGFDPFDDY